MNTIARWSTPIAWAVYVPLGIVGFVTQGPTPLILFGAGCFVASIAVYVTTRLA